MAYKRRKLPYRPDSDISQSYNDGLVTVYGVSDAAQPGHMPENRLTLKAILHFAERRLGLTRYYIARQNMVNVARVIRIPRPPPDQCPSPQDIALTSDGQQYQIDLVQSVTDVYPPSLDLSLARVDQIYNTEE